MPAVLIVDQSLTIRMDLKEAFDAAGHSTLVCATAAAARLELSARPYDLIVLDMLLPDADGIELLKELRQDPHTAATPVMLFASEAEVGSRFGPISIGPVEYIRKPYDRTHLVRRARHLLDRTGVPLDTLTILVIDDSATFRHELREALHHAGYEVLLAETGEDGLRLARERLPDALVIDNILPDIPGTQVLNCVKTDPILRHIPCLLLTASDARENELRALAAGADAYMRKETDCGKVLARLAAVIRRAEHAPGDIVEAAPVPQRILAVDDSPTYLNALAVQLRQDGYDVLLARSGEEALGMLATQLVDCVLLDLIMPGLSGEETCRRIKASAAFRHVPVLMLTSREDQDAMLGSLNAGADDFVSKSTQFAVLAARLRAQLRRKRFEDENRRIAEQLHHRELEAADARANRDLAETRAALLAELECKNVQLQTANTAKDRFIAVLSHELRTPLTPVLMTISAMADEDGLPDSMREDVQMVRRNVELEVRLIDDLVDLSRITRGTLTLDRRVRDVHAKLRNALQLCYPEAIQKGQQIITDLSAGQCHVNGDGGRLQQVFWNLLRNAIKFTPSGGRVEVRSSNPRPGWLRVEVTDTGVGIEPHRLSSIFDAFAQANPSVPREFGGLGLGLAITKALVEMHGGSIQADSNGSGKGATFIVELPVVASPVALASYEHADRSAEHEAGTQSCTC